MVLMVYNKVPDYGPGGFRYEPCRATEEEASIFSKELAVLEYKEEIIDNIKESHPELLI
jgi:hypothetical protein